MSPEDICNEALSEIGGRTFISSLTTDTSYEAQVARQFYNITRQQILRAARWGFARKQETLTEIGTLTAGTSPYPWYFAYRYPPDCAAVRFLVPTPLQAISDTVVVAATISGPTWWLPNRANRFIVQQVSGEKAILTNVAVAIAIYTKDEEDCDIFDSLFHNALVKALASKFAMPISGDKDLRRTCEQLALMAVNDAQVADGNEAMPSTDHTPDWITARSGYFGSARLAEDLGIWYGGAESLPWGG